MAREIYEGTTLPVSRSFTSCWFTKKLITAFSGALHQSLLLSWWIREMLWRVMDLSLWDRDTPQKWPSYGSFTLFLYQRDILWGVPDQNTFPLIFWNCGNFVRSVIVDLTMAAACLGIESLPHVRLPAIVVNKTPLEPTVSKVSRGVMIKSRSTI
jgi:hypothetical protein